MDNTKSLILFLLEDVGEPMTTYEVAQQLGISFSTAMRHLFELALEGKVERLVKVEKRVKKYYWVRKYE